MLSSETSPPAPATTPGSDPSPVAGLVPQVDQRAEFITELARAMQAAMSSAHQRVVEDLERRRTTHVGALLEVAAQANRESSRRAEQEVAIVDAWVEAETRRVRLEGEVRIAARRAELETRLARGRSEVESAIEKVDAAIADHRGVIDAFLVRMAAEPDPATIARLVDDLPPLPSLGEGGPADRSAATSEKPGAAAPSGVAERTPNAPTEVASAAFEPAGTRIVEDGLIGVMGPRATMPNPAAEANEDPAPSVVSDGAAAVATAVPQGPTPDTRGRAGSPGLGPIGAWLRHATRHDDPGARDD